MAKSWNGTERRRMLFVGTLCSLRYDKGGNESIRVDTSREEERKPSLRALTS